MLSGISPNPKYLVKKKQISNVSNMKREEKKVPYKVKSGLLP